MSPITQKILTLLLCLGLSLVYALPASSQDKLPQTRKISLQELKQNWPSLKLHQQANVIEQLIAQGKFKMADQFLNQYRPTGKISLLQKDFLKARILRGQGKLKDAASLYRAILAQRADLTKVRFELAATLYQMNEDQSAKHHFKLVQGSPYVDKRTNLVINRYVDAIGRRKKWHFSPYITIAPSTNLNNGTHNKVISNDGLIYTIDEDARAKSGVGLRGGFQAGYRLPLSENLDMIFAAGLNHSEYERDYFDDTLINGEMGLKYRFKKGTVGLYGTVAKRWYAHDDYLNSWGGRLHTSYKITRKDILFGDISYTENDYDDYGYKNGLDWGGNLYLDHYFSSSSFVRLLGGVKKSKTTLAHLDYDGFHLGLGLYKELPFGVSVYGQGIYSQNEYAGNYPTKNEPRKDDSYLLSLQLTKRDWQIMGFAPKFLYSFRSTRSNVEFYDANSHSVDFTFTKDF